MSIAIIAEGSYPYVAGGVSSWVHQIISGLSEFEFELIVLLAKRDDLKEPKYKIPPNVIKVHHLFLQEGIKKPLFLPTKIQNSELLDRFFESYFSFELFEKLALDISKIKDKRAYKQQIIYSYETFTKMMEHYKTEEMYDKSFLDYFWSLRSITIGVINTLLYDMPECDIYHSVSTGYAGLLGALAKIKYPKSSLLLTEHGIYTRERRMEITVSEWPDVDTSNLNPRRGVSIYKKLWTDIFFNMSNICYTYADTIISLNEKNNLLQISEGADPKKVKMVRNGVNINRFRYIKRELVSTPPIIGFLGRVVKIKDVKTFIKSAGIVLKKYPDAQFHIAGPADEDEEYYNECLMLVDILGIESSVKFLGRVDSAEFFERIDIMVLTSLSEGQPLVISEAGACGVPSIATDVGGCKEMLFGGGDDTLGVSGIITPVNSSSSTASAIIKMIEDSEFYKECSKVGRERSESFYDEAILFKKYRGIYGAFL